MLGISVEIPSTRGLGGMGSSGNITDIHVEVVVVDSGIDWRQGGGELRVVLVGGCWEVGGTSSGAVGIGTATSGWSEVSATGSI